MRKQIYCSLGSKKGHWPKRPTPLEASGIERNPFPTRKYKGGTGNMRAVLLSGDNMAKRASLVSSYCKR